MSYPGHWGGGGSYPSADVQSVYSTAPADWAILAKGMMFKCVKILGDAID